MADPDEGEGPELSAEQKEEIAKWFLTNAPAGEIQYVAKGAVSLPPRSAFLFIKGKIPGGGFLSVC